jgi:hypothetical protein
MPNVVWIEEWLRRKEEKEWLRRLRFHIHSNGGQCWYPSRNENGELEWEPVYGVPEPVCVLREWPKSKT